MITFKQGVRMDGLQPQIVLAILIAESVYRSFGRDLLFITSISDGIHSPNSLHYSGNAVDLRIMGIDPFIVTNIKNKLSAYLGDNYDVVLEKTHIHIEYDPPK